MEINISFDIIFSENYVSSKILFFVYESNLLYQDLDFDKMESFICKVFFYLDDMEKFFQDMLKELFVSFIE